MEKDLREEIKDEMLERIKKADRDDVQYDVFVFRDFVLALRAEAETITLTKP